MACPPGGAIVCAGGAPYFVDIATGSDVGAFGREMLCWNALSSTRLTSENISSFGRRKKVLLREIAAPRRVVAARLEAPEVRAHHALTLPEVVERENALLRR